MQQLGLHGILYGVGQKTKFVRKVAIDYIYHIIYFTFNIVLRFIGIWIGIQKWRMSVVLILIYVKVSYII